MAETKLTKIALAGRKFCGKDTLADLAIEEHNAKVFSFSDKLKEIAHSLFPFMDLDYTPEEKETKVVYNNLETGVKYVPRDIWQSLDILPTIFPYVFIDRLHMEIDVLLNMWQFASEGEWLKKYDLFIIIKDVRRPAELEYIKNQGYKLIYIDTDDERSFNEKSMHKSESFQDLLEKEADLVFMNSKKDKDYLNRMRNVIKEVTQ